MMITPPVRECTVQALRHIVLITSESGRCTRILRAVLFSPTSLIADCVKLFSYTSDSHILEERQYPRRPNTPRLRVLM